MKCQHCGTEKCGISYHEMMNMNLCMRCTDKLLSLINNRDVNEFWTDAYAIKEGLEPFTYPTPYLLKYLKQRSELMDPVMRLDYNFRKGMEL